jgi:hypothetical protein
VSADIKEVAFPSSAQQTIDEQVAMLEKAIREARTGNFQTLMLVALTNDEHCLMRWSGAEDLVVISGHLARLQHATQRRLDGDIP